MRAPKYKGKDGKALDRPKVTTLLHPELFEMLRLFAGKRKESLSDAVADILAKKFGWAA